jgi:hypothetical protein
MLYAGMPFVITQEAKYVESWPNTNSAWAGWSRFDFQWIGMVEYTPCYSALGSPTRHKASQQKNTYGANYQTVDRASTLCTLWS